MNDEKGEMGEDGEEELSDLSNANARSQRFGYTISQIATLSPEVALNRSSKSQIAARYAAFWHAVSCRLVPLMGNVSETPTPTTCLKSTAVHLQFVRQYAPHLYRRASWLLSFEERETLQYASHLYCSMPPICTAARPPFVRQYFWKNTGGRGHRNGSDLTRSVLNRSVFKTQMQLNRKH